MPCGIHGVYLDGKFLMASFGDGHSRRLLERLSCAGGSFFPRISRGVSARQLVARV
jgi:hypothetical protein